MTAFTLKGYYYATKTRKFIVILGQEFKVDGKRHARKLCLELQATPWNF